METKVIKIENTEDKIYKGLELLEKIASKIIDKSNSAVSLKSDKENSNTVTLETLQQDNDLLLTFVGTYFAIVPTLKNMVSEYQKIKDSETFRSKIIDREVRNLTSYQESLEVGTLSDKPTDLQVLKIQTQDAFKSTIEVLEKLKDTYSNFENTLKIEM